MIEHDNINPDLRAAIEAIPVDPQVTYGTPEGGEVRYNLWTHNLEVTAPPASETEMRALGEGLVAKGVFKENPFAGPTRVAPPAFVDFLRTMDQLGWIKTSEAQLQDLMTRYDAWSRELDTVMQQFGALLELNADAQKQ